jgi:uncharacterized protein
MKTAEETATVFPCDGVQLIGVLHTPAKPRSRGVVIVPGAPQYRAGSHRQFLLLARDLAAAGFPVLRFDYRGMGDSDGLFAGFEGVSSDLKAAVDHFVSQVPEVTEIAMWGLCDGASAISFYAPSDPRVSGIALVNPWVRSEESEAQARIRHYYGTRLVSPEFWRKLIAGKLEIVKSIRDFGATLRTIGAKRGSTTPGERAGTQQPLPSRVAGALSLFQGRILIFLSGADLTAQEFDTAVLKSAAMASWHKSAKPSVNRIEAANHTYSTAEWRAQVHAKTIAWLKECV